MQSTWLALTPENLICIINFRVFPFESDPDHFVTWELVGLIESAHPSQDVILDDVVKAFLVLSKGSKNRHSVVI